MAAETSCDLIVVGAGILGLATAYRAMKRGLCVTVIEAASRPVGASVQNFGHAAFTVQDDAVLDVAERAQQGWAAVAKEAGLWASQPGTWVAARTALEMQVLEEFAAHRGPARVRIATAKQVANGVGNADPACVGGAHLPFDMRINPRQAPDAIAAYLASRGVQFYWGTAALDIADGRVATARGTFAAERVIVCPGKGLRTLFPRAADDFEVRTCALAMTLIERPARIPANLAMLTGTGIARYGGFSTMPSHPELIAELEATSPELVAMDANVMMTGLEEGLIVGDSHVRHTDPYPFVDESEPSGLLAAAGTYLGIDSPTVLQRWQGTYPTSTQTNLVLTCPDAQTTIGVMTTGAGMTLSFGLAERFLNNAPIPGY